jgi:hypothetical protein
MRKFASLSVAAVLSMVAGTAMAVPSIVDRVPADAAITIAIPSIENLEKDIRSVATIFGAPAGMINLDSILSQVGMGGVVAKNGPLAFFVVMPGEGQTEPSQGVIFTTADFAGVVKAVGGKEENGIATAEIAGEPAYFKKLDGEFVFVSPSMEFAKKFEGKKGSAEAMKTLIGPMGDKASDKSDLSILINFDKVRPFVEMGLDQAMAQMEQAPIPEEQLEQLTQMMEVFGSTVVKDAKAIVASVNIDASGVSLDLTTRFADGSKLAEIAATPGNAPSLLGKVPAMPYLAVLTADFANPGVRKLAALFPEPKPAAKDGAKDAAKADAKKPADMMDMKLMKQSMELSDGSATVIGVSPAGLMGGLLTRSVTYTATKKPAELLKLTKDAMNKMADSGLAEVTITDGGAEVGGKKVDVYDVRLKPDGENPMAAQMMAGLYGMAGGPNGYISTTENGIITTFAKSSELMEKSVKAAGGSETLADDKVLAATGKNLPSGRVAEIYVGIKGILDSVGGFLAMANPNFKLDLPENLPPVALSIAPGGGSVQATIYAPMPVLKVLGDVAKQMRQGGEEGEEAKPANGGGDKGNEKPKF